MGLNLGSTKAQLFLLSVLSLFLEMMLIRFMGTEVLLFSYFKNIILMSAFLGLGLGFLAVKSKHDLFKWSAFGVLLLNGLLMVALPLGITFLSYCDPLQCMFFFAGEGNGQGSSFPIMTSIRTLAIMIALFGLCAFCFVGIGQQIAKRFDELKPLQAYSINVFGALIGTGLFSALSYLQTSPGMWLIACGIMYMLVKFKPSHAALVALGLFYALWLGPYTAKQTFGDNYAKTLWSPYFRIDLVEGKVDQPGGKPIHLGYDVKVSYDTFQLLWDADREEISKLPADQAKKLTQQDPHSWPYRVLGITPKRVLILGAGNGSDAQAALDAGAQEVDAVDIDPAICDLGKTLHRDKPYSNEKVHLYNMDARTFLRNCQKKYDLIVFAYLDSHTAFSCLSALRTDNYVFTKESYESAAKLLAPDGLVFVSFICFQDWLWERHSKALGQATGSTPVGCIGGSGVTQAGCLVAGPGLKNGNLKFNWPSPVRTVNMQNTTELATDDWPFLFLAKREFSSTYCLPIFLILVFSGSVIGKHLLGGHRNFFNWLMLGLGAGFMLMEVRGMANLSLLFGSTWIVNSAVISTVLVFALLGNWLAARLKLKHATYIFIALLISLMISSSISPAQLTSYGETAGRLLGVTVFLVPIAFSSTLFSLLFKQSASPSTALAFNIFGGLLGVCLEYVSMLTGVGMLGWIALGIYTAGLFVFRLWFAGLDTSAASS